ncbi:MAG: site-2 protease family protein [Armatimonadetes bacterium]|nr:site-2 protease family protein [Armatimonadota bacterium]
MRLGTILGIPIRVDVSWSLVFLLMTLALARGLFPQWVPGQTAAAYLLMGAAASIALFACIVLHELAHAVVGRRYGMKFDDIVLFMFGGVARLRTEPISPRAEIMMAVAGPLMSAALALGFWSGAAMLPNASPALTGILGYLAFLNTALVLFNLVPGFPLDGGRIFRAGVWHFTGDFRKATRWATLTGRAIGLVLIALGLFDLLTGRGSGLWTMLVGWFLFAAARASDHQSRLEATLKDVPVRTVMNPDPPVVEPHSTVAEAVRSMALARSPRVPVLDLGRLVGQVEAERVRGISPHEWESTWVRDVMTPIERTQTVEEGDTALRAFRRTLDEQNGELYVVSGGRLAGTVTRDSLWDLARLRLEQRRAS